MTPRQAAELMDLIADKHLTQGAVDKRFRELAHAGHSDHGGETDMMELRRARDVLKLYASRFEVKCEICRDTGRVPQPGSFREVRCVCQGSKK